MQNNDAEKLRIASVMPVSLEVTTHAAISINRVGFPVAAVNIRITADTDLENFRYAVKNLLLKITPAMSITTTEQIGEAS